MAVSIEFRLSGGAANADPALSLGGAMSSTVIGSSSSTFWDAVSDAERVAGETEYRCLYVTNTGDQTAYNVKIWVSTDATNADHEIALDGGGLNATAEDPAGTAEETAPSGESFSAAASEGAALNLGTLAPGDRYAVWERRIVSAGEAAGAQSRTLRVKYES